MVYKYYVAKEILFHQKKPDTLECKEMREQIDLHISIVDLLAACTRNSPFGISQAQKLVNFDNLLDTILSSKTPYIMKRHYLNLLFEVYMRKV